MSKSIRLAVLSVLAVSLLPASTPVQVTPSIGVTNSTKNPLQIAILHWYDANQTTTFTVGTEPIGVAFDGANMWVANVASNNVSKLRASDGKLLGTFTGGGRRFEVGGGACR